MNIPSLPAGLPTEFHAIYKQYLQKATLTRELLVAKVRNYLGIISVAATQRQLDIGTACEIGAGLMRLLWECEQEELCHVQVAVDYFLESHDAEPDLGSSHGFDDDARLYNTVCLHLGRGDLAVASR